MKTIPVYFLAAGMLLPAVCLAQPEAPPKGPPGDARGEHKGPLIEFIESWKNADTDHDGAISKAEFDAVPRLSKLPSDKRANLFARLDKNGDGKIDRAELELMTRLHDGQRPMKRLWELDADKSGGVDFNEFKAGPIFGKLAPEKQQEIFNHLDTDGDKVITPKDKPEPPFEHRDGKPRPGGPDGDRRGDGDRHGDGPLRFNAKMDTNQDGSISFDEFRANERIANLTEDGQEDRFEALDKNHDLKLTPDELGPPPPPPAPEKPAE